MGTDFSIKPVGGSVTPPLVEPTPLGAKSAVQTDLPAHKTVTAADDSVVVQNNPQAANDRLSRQVVIDRAAAEIVYRVVDNRTALVVRQFPDEARLRARAYLRAQDIARQDKVHKKTDMKA
ncbi:MAG: hypothetical protein HY242_05900 [Afipia sp.]|nr:hypothetical protein [Afipia sp.]